MTELKLYIAGLAQSSMYWAMTSRHCHAEAASSQLLKVPKTKARALSSFRKASTSTETCQCGKVSRPRLPEHDFVGKVHSVGRSLKGGDQTEVTADENTARRAAGNRFRVVIGVFKHAPFWPVNNNVSKSRRKLRQNRDCRDRRQALRARSERRLYYKSRSITP